MNKEEHHRIKLETYNGKTVRFMDFSGLYMNSFIQHLHYCYEYIKNQGETDMLFLFDVTNAKVFGDTLKESKIFANDIIPFRKRSALIGVDRAKSILLNGILRFTGASKYVKSFKTKQEALEWLTE